MKVDSKSKSTISHRFVKFALIGLAALSIVSPALANQSSFEHDAFQHESIQTMEHVQSLDYVGKNINVVTHVFKENVGNDFLKAESLTETANNSVVHEDKSCTATVTYSQDGTAAFLGVTEELSDLSAPLSESQRTLTRELVLLHEMSHCEFARFDNPILVEGNPELEQKMNYYFNFNSTVTENAGQADSRKISSIVDTLNENFADTYAVIQMIKIHGQTPDVMRVVHSLDAQRNEMTLMQGRHDKLEAHSTQYAVQEILRPDTLSQIEATSSPEALKNLALKIANHSVQKMYATYSDMSLTAYGVSSIKNGVEAIVTGNIQSKNITQSEAEIMKMPYGTPEKSLIIKLAYNTLDKLAQEGFKVTPKEVKNNNHLVLTDTQAKQLVNASDESFDNMNYEQKMDIRKTERGYWEYIKNHAQANMEDHIRADSPATEMGAKMLAVRDRYIAQEGVPVMVSTSNKSMALAQMLKIRETSSGVVAASVQLK